MQVQSLVWEDPLEKEKAPHSSILTWWIPWTEEPGGTVHSVAKSQTWLKRLSTRACTAIVGVVFFSIISSHYCLCNYRLLIFYVNFISIIDSYYASLFQNVKYSLATMRDISGSSHIVLPCQGHYLSKDPEFSSIHQILMRTHVYSLQSSGNEDTLDRAFI